MAVFQIASRTVQLPVPPKRRTRRFPYQWYAIARVVVGMPISGLFFTLLLILFGHPEALFILLPVFMSLASAQFQGYNLNVLLKGTPLYLLLTACLTFIYYGTIIIGVSFIQRSIVSHIIVISTALAWTIMLGPVRGYAQKRIEQRFNRRNREAAKTIEAFTATLREEIDLAQLRERFLAVIQQTLQPYSVSLWTHTSHEQQEPSSSTEQIMVADDDPLLAYMLRHPDTFEIDRLQLDSPLLQKLKLRAAELLLPLASQGELLGLLILGSHLKGEAYSQEERTLLDTLAPQVAPALRVAQLVQERQEQVRERERNEQELRTAQRIQRSLLPEALPLLVGWQLATYYQPAREVGGDFYDFIPFDDGRLGLVIGDATDHGMPAALMMTTTATMLRTAAQATASPAEVLARVNDLLYARIPSGMFVTCFYAVLNPKNGGLCYANAGQDWPFRRYQGGISELEATGMPLGMMPGTYYQEHETTLSPGESLLFYSDGLVEAHNPSREMLGFPRLKTLLAEHADDGASIIDFLLGELKCFTGEGWEQEDDVTLVTLQRMPESHAQTNRAIRERPDECDSGARCDAAEDGQAKIGHGEP